MKNFISVLLGAAIVLSMIPASVVSLAANKLDSFPLQTNEGYSYTDGDAEEGTYLGLEYIISDGQVTITDYTGTETDVKIPETIKGYPVTVIGDNAFSHCFDISSITMPNSLTAIGDGAFYICSQLEYVTVPKSVTSIGDRAFAVCTNLKYITLPAGITRIGDYAFENCAKLTKINIPRNVASIGNYAFRYCSGFKSVTIPENVTSIGDSAFEFCTELVSITLPEKLEHLGAYAFYCCYDLERISIPKNVKSIGNYTFYNCRSLTRVTFTKSVKSIGINAFYGCNDIKDVHYYGSEKDFAKTTLDSGNRTLLDADLLFLRDINGDGVVNAMDSHFIRTVIICEMPETTGIYNIFAADLNDDERINLKDLYIISDTLRKLYS